MKVDIRALLLALLLVPVSAQAVTRVGIVLECPYFCEGEEKHGYIRELIDDFFNLHVKSQQGVKFYALPSFRISQMVETGQLEFGVLNSKDIRYNSRLKSFDSVLGVSYSGIANDIQNDFLVLSEADLIGEEVCFINLPPSLRETFLSLHSKSPSRVISIKGANSVARGFEMLRNKRTQMLVGEFNSLKNYLGKNPELAKDYKVSASSFTGYNSLVLFTSASNKKHKELNALFATYLSEKRESGELKRLMQSYFIEDWSQQVTY